MNFAEYIRDCMGVEKHYNPVDDRLLLRKKYSDNASADFDAYVEVSIVDWIIVNEHSYILKLRFLTGSKSLRMNTEEWHDETWCATWDIIQNLTHDTKPLTVNINE